MKTSKLFLLLIAFGCAGLMQAAEINDVFIAYNPGSPPDPTFDDNLKEWNWAAPWTPITLPQAEPMLLQPGQSIWLGLANEQRLEPWFKLVTLEFHTGGVVPIEYKAGFEDGTTITWGMDLVDSTITYRRWEGRIDPQPGWEWVRLYNQLDTETALRITNFTSVCVIPAPGAILLAAIGTGTVGCLRRRRVL